MLDHMGKFMVTLHKDMYICLKHSKIGTRSNTCFIIMRCRTCSKIVMWSWTKAVEVFAINTRPAMTYDIGEMKKTAKTMHEELLELIQTLSDTSTSSDGSSPKIFYGRESELDHIMKMLAQKPARIAILGGGGMGKTSLARAGPPPSRGLLHN
ncbi:hypothetical protein B0H14DRAFT_3126935 [Mycena olivaceomarginata]|nr:hypothetical protein B0H14DRAFT_3126935 [Mycena olivaceomarginata]